MTRALGASVCVCVVVAAGCSGELGGGGGTTTAAGTETSTATTTGEAGGAQGGAGTSAGGGGGAHQGGDGGSSGGGGATSGVPQNRVGIGLVGPGNGGQWDRTKELCGPGGHIKLIFPGVTKGMTEPPQEWKDAIAQVYARDLVPVVRIAPPWGDRDVRKDSDDAGHKSYKKLSEAYAAVAGKLPLRDGWPLWLEIHNEPNLCYEWVCNPNDAPPHANTQAGWIHFEDTAAEYASFLRDVASALHAIGDPRIKVMNGGLAPGGTVTCQCGGDGFQPGITSKEFLQAMQAAVPGIFGMLDAFASHAYPASGEGYGFFEPYDQSIVGLKYFEKELQAIGMDPPVYITETGWTIGAGAKGSREQVADWTVKAWDDVWSKHPAIAAVMPFMLQDANWNDFAWVDPSNQPYPVFGAVKAWRCSKNIPGPCQP